MYEKEYLEGKRRRVKRQRKEYYEKNKEKLKKYYKDNKEKVKEYNKKYREDNKERAKEWHKEYREKHKERFKKYEKEYRKNNREKIITFYRETKKLLVDENGGKCQICGYNKCIAALDFHHKDKSKKERGITFLINRRDSLKIIRKEIKKCILLCSNCHRELHYKTKNFI